MLKRLTEGQNFCSSKRDKNTMSEIPLLPMNIFTQWYLRREARTDNVSIEIMLRTLRSGYCGRIFVWGKGFSQLHHAQTKSMDHPASYPTKT
jgi:hypothetical protein